MACTEECHQGLAAAEAGAPGPCGPDGPEPARRPPRSQFCQEGIRRIIAVRSALSCKDSPDERSS